MNTPAEHPCADPTFGTILPGDIGAARDRLDKLGKVVDRINSVAGCAVVTAREVYWDSAELVVSLDFEKLLKGGDSENDG
jgi:hypothetical protein